MQRQVSGLLILQSWRKWTLTVWWWVKFIFHLQEAGWTQTNLKNFFLIENSLMSLPGHVKVKVAQLCPTLCDPTDYIVWGILKARIREWVAFPFSRGSSQTQGLNPGLPHCRWIFFYQLSHKRSPRLLEWITCLFSRGSSWPRNRTGVSCIASQFFTNSANREAPVSPRSACN